jgi:hypothetical protein
MRAKRKEAEKTSRKRATRKPTADPLEELQHTLVSLQDDLSETMAWTALLCDGLCGILAENGSDTDPKTHTGARFAAIWLKQRNQRHAATLEAARRKLRAIRGNQRLWPAYSPGRRGRIGMATGRAPARNSRSGG